MPTCFRIHPARLVFILTTSLVVTCTSEQSRERVDTSRVTSSALITRVDNQVVVHDSLATLVSRLRTLRGEFRRVPPYGLWEFFGRKELFIAIAQFGDSAVERLVSCLDDSSSSATRIGDRVVLFGAVCYEALNWVAYVEMPVEKLPWAGDVEPTAGAQQLRRAKAAWEEAVKNKTYSLL